MGVTSKLLALYRVDQQLRGLRSRLDGAESYLKQQDQHLAQIDARHHLIAGQVQSLEAAAKNDEVESDSIEERIAELRERMNNAQTSKEHSALLTEINTLKADKELAEERALESLSKLEALRQQLADLDTEKAERVKVRAVALKDRDEKEAEIKDRVTELESERVVAKEDVPPSAMGVYDERLALGIEDIMAPIEEQSRRNMDYTCGSCFTHLPIEQVSILLNRGDLTRCPSCEAILYIETSLRDEITTAQEKKRKRSAAATD